MKCPKCGYHSFDYLENCKKCGQDLGDHKAKFNLRGFFSPDQPAETMESAAEAEDTTAAATGEAGDVDFGFDFLDEDEQAADQPAAATDIDLGSEEDLNLSQPFGIDGETVPAEEASDSKKKAEDDGFEF